LPIIRSGEEGHRSSISYIDNYDTTPIVMRCYTAIEGIDIDGTIDGPEARADGK